MSEYSEHPELPPALVEQRDVPVRALALGLAGVALVLLSVGALVTWLYPGQTGSSASGLSGPVPHFPAPALQSNPAADMVRLYRAQMERLNGVAWARPDEGPAGAVRLPIGQAMRSLASEGIPDWPRIPIDPAPRDPTLRNGTPQAAATQHGPQRNLAEQSPLPAAPP